MKKLLLILGLSLAWILPVHAQNQGNLWGDNGSNFPIAPFGMPVGTPTCGTGCTSITTTPPSTNTRGSATSSSSVSSIIVNFSGTMPSTPVCDVGSNETSAVLGYSVSTTAITITTATAITTKVFTWICTL